MSLIRLSFYPLFGSFVFVAVIVALLGLILLTVRPRGEQLSPAGRRWLMALRACTLVLLAFAMLRPTLVYTRTQRLATSLYVLLDQSESMSRADERDGQTRFQAAQNALEEAKPQLEKFQKQAEVSAFLFDSELKPLEIQNGTVGQMPKEPAGTATAIGASLDAVRERAAGKRVIGTILLSDGSQRTWAQRATLPHDAATRLRDAAMPLYAVTLGQAGASDIQDIAVNELQANDRVFEKNTFLINGSLRIAGYGSKSIPVQLHFEDEKGVLRLVAETTVQGREEGQNVPFQLQYAPPKTGYYKYTVSVPKQDKELIETNNAQSNFVRVVNGGLTVLFMQGERNPEQGPLQQSLGASTDIDITYRSFRFGRYKTQGGGSLQTRLEQETRRRPALVDEDFAPGKFNVYILENVNAKAFKPEELQALADRVRDGAGLIILGGFQAFGAGGFADTPLAEVFPVELRNIDVQPLDGPIRQDLHWQQPLTLQLTPEGRRHYVMRLTPDAKTNAETWAALPPLDGANRLGKLKPGASLLAEGPQQEPLLVSQLYGLGRVLAFAGDTTYRWRLAGFVDEHKLFWRQVVLWLAKMENVQDGDCWVSVDNVKPLPGEPAKFRVFLRSAQGEELQNFSAKATVVKPDGKQEQIALVDEEGTPTGTFFSTDLPGDYTIRVTATHDSLQPTPSSDPPTREATARFMVVKRNLELDTPVAYPQLLRSISELTGGEAVEPDELPKLLEDLMEKSDELVEKRETKRSLYDSQGLLIAFICILGVEWFCRKRWGMV